MKFPTYQPNTITRANLVRALRVSPLSVDAIVNSITGGCRRSRANPGSQKAAHEKCLGRADILLGYMVRRGEAEIEKGGYRVPFAV